MNRKRLVCTIVPLLVLVAATFACVPSEAKPTVTIKAPPNGSQVAVGQVVEVLFVAEDTQAVMWVQMTVEDDVVATQQSPLAGGQTPFEGILRWTPSKIGTVKLVVVAHNAGDQDSDPAAVSISVVEAVAGAPTLTPVPTPRQPAQPATRPTATRPPGQPTATRPPGQPTPTATQPPGQPTPTPTATQPPGQPTSTPTKTPTKTPTPTPILPVIDDFSVDKAIIDLSGCATLSWQTTNATEVYLGPDPVPVDGSREFCAGDLGGPGSTMFELRAVHGSEEVSEYVSITVEESSEETLIVPFFPAMSGSVADDGTVFSNIYPGDNDSNHGYRSYITFDISGLPSAAIIKSAVLDLGPCNQTGDPFTDLAGQLLVLWTDYGALDGTDYDASSVGLGFVYGCPGGNIDVTASVDANKWRSHYQISLAWSVDSDFDGQTDDVTYTSPVLYITFERP
jgi:hypothetical protein